MIKPKYINYISNQKKPMKNQIKHSEGVMGLLHEKGNGLLKWLKHWSVRHRSLLALAYPKSSLRCAYLGVAFHSTLDVGRSMFDVLLSPLYGVFYKEIINKTIQ